MSAERGNRYQHPFPWRKGVEVTDRVRRGSPESDAGRLNAARFDMLTVFRQV